MNHALTTQEQQIVDTLQDSFDCHTVLLYGSRARGTARPDSDWNIIAVREKPPTVWCDDVLEEVGMLHIQIYPNPAVQYHFNSPFFRTTDLAHGKVLCEHDGLGARIIQHAQTMLREGYPPEAEGFMGNMRAYYRHDVLDALEDATQNPIYQNYRLQQGLHRSLRYYLRARGKHMMSPIEGFRYIQSNDPEAYALFERAYKPDATLEDVKALFAKITAV